MGTKRRGEMTTLNVPDWSGFDWWLGPILTPDQHLLVYLTYLLLFCPWGCSSDHPLRILCKWWMLVTWLLGGWYFSNYVVELRCSWNECLTVDLVLIKVWDRPQWYTCTGFLKIKASRKMERNWPTAALLAATDPAWLVFSFPPFSGWRFVWGPGTLAPLDERTTGRLDFISLQSAPLRVPEKS